MEGKEDIFLNSGIPEEFVRFFRIYQEKFGKCWHSEKNGRFAINFRYHMLEGMQKNIQDSDLLVAAAILLSHHESYFEDLLDPQKRTFRDHDLKKAAETIRELAKYMAKNAGELSFGHNPTFTKVRLSLGLKGEEVMTPARRAKLTEARYLEFFCNLPEIWGFKPKTA